MRKLLSVLSTVVILSISNITMVLADGNPYGPYNPHKPIDTGFEDTGVFYILAGVVFVLGMGFLTTAKILKAKLSLQK